MKRIPQLRTRNQHRVPAHEISENPLAVTLVTDNFRARFWHAMLGKLQPICESGIHILLRERHIAAWVLEYKYIY